jgi:LPXTG-motif cell wall-anchored protein
MAYFTYPARSDTGGISYTQYYATIGITLLVILFLAYFLKKKEDIRKKRKKKENK